ncbi:flavin prenyltransferase UbiX [Pseudonocardia sulfidoxydans NBRC 16205]|uniref:Flavin prenyltransferase UbiX n=1 Tax=Pseudonocardia sulfidoxydans NBRC 16205 TaxID=1223511 RepID=A0A511DF32_9PSEU|nr:UbiX family flavin prenyltransferase [Pseudonocardia sulfidoxydans]GEL23147.1 flavin prenyltransferase UbiX [Pseudonocardia sulfidoxydans NBRC 16205]
MAVTGASGSVYGVTLLRILRERDDLETHLVVSRSGALTLRQETGLSPADVHALADVVHRPADVGASIASGSFATVGMVVAPCSIRTLSAIAYCDTADLVSRAADVTLKEGRPLVLMVRETPLHLGHLRAMTAAAEAGAVIAPPVPAFYHPPRDVEDLVEHSVRRVLDRLGLDGGSREWAGLRGEAEDGAAARRNGDPARRPPG